MWEVVIDYVGGSVVAAGLVVVGVYAGRKLFERGSDSAIQKGINEHRGGLDQDLEDHKANIEERFATQRREHERELEALRSELRAVESRGQRTCESTRSDWRRSGGGTSRRSGGAGARTHTFCW